MLTSALNYLLHTIVSLLTMMLMLRFFMQLFKAPFANPLGQMVIALTDFVVKPARKIIPSWGKIDLSTLSLALLLQGLWHAWQLGIGANTWLSLILASLLGLLQATVNLFFYLILLQAILSWVNPYTPIAGTLDKLTQPILAPIRRVIPNVNGLDFSPMVALILLQMLNIAIIPSLTHQTSAFF